MTLYISTPTSFAAGGMKKEETNMCTLVCWNEKRQRKTVPQNMHQFIDDNDNFNDAK